MTSVNHLAATQKLINPTSAQRQISDLLNILQQVNDSAKKESKHLQSVSSCDYIICYSSTLDFGTFLCEKKKRISLTGHSPLTVTIQQHHELQQL